MKGVLDLELDLGLLLPESSTSSVVGPLITGYSIIVWCFIVGSFMARCSAFAMCIGGFGLAEFPKMSFSATSVADFIVGFLLSGEMEIAKIATHRCTYCEGGMYLSWDGLLQEGSLCCCCLWNITASVRKALVSCLTPSVIILLSCQC